MVVGIKELRQDAHLVLLQEAQTTPELVQFALLTILPPIRYPLSCCHNILRRNDPFGGTSSVLLPVT